MRALHRAGEASGSIALHLLGHFAVRLANMVCRLREEALKDLVEPLFGEGIVPGAR